MARTALLFLLFLLGQCEAAAAETRVALVIGNARYANVAALPNAANDADMIAAALRRVGFATEEKTDLDHAGMQAALRSFRLTASGADIALIYYTGHGIEVGGTNFLVPVDARLAKEGDVDFEALPADMVLDAIGPAKRLRIVVLDACRTNPFTAMMSGGATRGIVRTGKPDPAIATTTRGIAHGLARVEPAGDMLVLYSAKAGTTAMDGKVNSPYALAFTRDIAIPGLEVGMFFRKLHDDVLAATDGRQEPYVYGSLTSREFYFVPPAAH